MLHGGRDPGHAPFPAQGPCISPTPHCCHVSPVAPSSSWPLRNTPALSLGFAPRRELTGALACAHRRSPGIAEFSRMASLALTRPRSPSASILHPEFRPPTGVEGSLTSVSTCGCLITGKSGRHSHTCQPSRPSRFALLCTACSHSFPTFLRVFWLSGFFLSIFRNAFCFPDINSLCGF